MRTILTQQAGASRRSAVPKEVACSRSSTPPGSCALQAEIDLSVNACNHLREAACNAYRQLICQRESFGFRAHDMLRRRYPIPDLLLPPDTFEDIIEA